MIERLIAIGDIHGCSAALNALIEAIDPSPLDTIVTLGDYRDCLAGGFAWKTSASVIAWGLNLALRANICSTSRVELNDG